MKENTDSKMDYDKAIKFLYSRELFGIKLGLSNIRKLLKKLGNPHKELKVIHVAGTNGKGSCCAMISSILQEQGYKVGMYTSPHLVDFRERILINKKKIGKENLLKLVKRIKPLLKKHTYFEVVTALAFLYFSEKKVDYVVAEVGMGGRLDATNVVDPLVSVITNISLEHKKHLGDTIEKIAFEKAGIVKKNRPCVSAATGSALKVIKKICRKRNSRLYVVKGKKKLKLNLKGSFQLLNASTSLKVIDILKKTGIEVSDKAINNGLKHILWPGRMEFISRNILLDCAHNPAAVDVLVKEIKKLKYKHLNLLIGIMKDKDIGQIVKKLVDVADHAIITKPMINRAAEPKLIAKGIKDYAIVPNVKEAVMFGKSITGRDDLLLITGSIFTVGEAMPYLS